MTLVEMQKSASVARSFASNPVAEGVDSADAGGDGGGGGGGGGSRSTACVIVRAGVCERTLKAVEWVLYFHVRAGCRSKEGMLAWFH